jgi:hypothetical protein
MTCREIEAFGSQVAAAGGWTREQWEAHPCHARSKRHTSMYSEPGSHSVYFRASDSPSGRMLVGGFTDPKKS